MNLKGSNTIFIRFREAETDGAVIAVILNGNGNKKAFKLKDLVNGNNVINFNGDSEELMSSSAFKSYIIRSYFV